jgi:tape measure domain-containing protein
MTIGDLIVTVGARIDGFKTAMADVSSTAGKAAGTAEQSAKRIETSFANLGPKLSSVGAAMTIALTLPMLGIGAAALKASGDMESLKMGLNTITHNAAETEKQLARLKEVAKIPGLDFQGAVKGSINLQAAGFSATMAERALKAFGNALAAVGKGRDDLEGVNLVLTQIMNKPKVMAQDLNQLRERLPQISQMMKAAFGTAVSEDIQKLGITGSQFVERMITEFEKIPPVASGLKNTFENVRDSAFQALAKLGDGMAPLAMRFIDVVVNPMIAAVTGLAAGFEKLPGPVQRAVVGLTGFLFVAGPVLSIIGRLITTIKTLGEVYAVASAVVTTRLIPALFGTQAAVAAVQAGTFALGGTFTAFGSTATAATTAATAGAVSLGVALGGIVAVLGAVVAGYIAWKNAQADIKTLDTNRKEGALGENFVFSGFGGTRITTPKKPATASNAAIPNAADYVTSLPAPRPTTGGGMDAEKRNAAFSQLHLQDLKKELQESEQALRMLGGAGLLTHDQMLKAAGAIAKMRAELKGTKEDIPLAEINALLPTLEQLQNLPTGKLGASFDDLKDLPTYNRNLSLLSDMLGASATAAALAARDAEYLTDAYHQFGLKTPQELKAVADRSRDAYELMRDSGTAAPEAIYVAWEQMTRDKYALLLADGKITRQQYDDMLAAIDASYKKSSQRRREYEWSAAQDMERAMSGAFNSLYRGLADNLIHWKGWADTIKSVGLNLAQDMLSTMIKVFMKPLEDQAVKLAGKLGDVLGGIFGGGGGATQAAGGIASAGGGAASAAGGVASTVGSFANVFNMVTGAVSAIAGVVSAIGTLRLEGTMNAVEHNTRYLQIQFEQYLAEHYLAKEQLHLKLDDIWNEIRNVVAAIPNIATMPQMQMAAAGGGNNITIHVNGAQDPRAIVDEITRYLRAEGVFV